METHKRPPRRLYTSEKYCNDCNKTKPIERFSERTGYQKGMHSSFCKECILIRKNKWVEKNKKHYKEYQIAYQKKYNMLHK